MENLLRTDFERRILRKMVNRHLYYNKNMSGSRQLSQKNRHCEGKCIFQNMHLHWECFKVQFSAAMSVYILSGKEANQLQVIYIRTLGNIQANFSTQGAILKSIPNFFSGSFRTAKKFALENNVFAYHTANKDHTKIL